MDLMQLSAMMDVEKNERLRTVLHEIEMILIKVREEGLEEYIQEHPEDYPEYIGFLKFYKYYKSQELKKQESSINTVAGVYIQGIKAQHKRYNELLLDRLHPDQMNGQLPSLCCDELESLRTFKEKEIPYATPPEIEILEAKGWRKGPGDPRLTLQSSVDWQVNQYCKEGHHFILGYEAASQYWGIPIRTLKRYSGPSFDVGNYKAFNVTSFDHFLGSRI